MLDIHTHRAAPYPEGIVSVQPDGFPPQGDVAQPCSVGLHPWFLPDTAEGLSAAIRRLEDVASAPLVLAIGEAGFDTLRGAPMALQTIAFRAQAELSERLRKPLVIHAVKTLDMIAGWHREIRATQPWVIHGFRGKPGAAAQLLKAGCMFSFGEHFNAETLRSLPKEVIFAETDESAFSIVDIIARLSEARGVDLLPVVRVNMKRLFPDVCKD